MVAVMMRRTGNAGIVYGDDWSFFSVACIEPGLLADSQTCKPVPAGLRAECRLQKRRKEVHLVFRHCLRGCLLHGELQDSSRLLAASWPGMVRAKTLHFSDSCVNRLAQPA